MSTNSLPEEKSAFEALFEFASMGICVADARGAILMVNNYLLLQFGYDNREELLGKKVEVLIPSRYESIHRKHRDNFVKLPERRPMGVGRDLFAIRKDRSEFPVEVSLSNYSVNGEVFIIAFIIDITRRKEIENAIVLQKELLAEKNRKIEELNDELERKVQNRTSQLQDAMEQIKASRDELTRALSKEKELSDLKSRFISMASHEFRTPLSTIMSSASLLAKYTSAEDQEKRNRHIDRIRSSVNNLVNILDDFLSIGKIEEGKVVANPVVVNVEEFITNQCNELSSLLKKGQRFNYVHKGEKLFTSDPVFLRNILINLLSNASKFSPEDSAIEVSSIIRSGTFTLTVSDTGIGISQDDQKHLFERFFRAANATNIEGTGLGLHIVAKYVELLHGRIEWHSELEKGTTFTIIINSGEL